MSYTTTVLSRQENFGWTHFTAGEDIEIKGLAVCSYDNDVGYYVFACDKEWKVVGDQFFDDLAEAKRDAEKYYEVSKIRWEEIKQNKL